MRTVLEGVVFGTYVADILPFRELKMSAVLTLKMLMRSLSRTSVKHVPSWVPFRRFAAQGRKMAETMASTPFNIAKEEIVSILQFIEPDLRTNTDDAYAVATGCRNSWPIPHPRSSGWYQCGEPDSRARAPD